MRNYLIATIVLCCAACHLQKDETKFYPQLNNQTLTHGLAEQSTAINTPSPIQPTKTITEINNL
jgi:hypothetical protein